MLSNRIERMKQRLIREGLREPSVKKEGVQMSVMYSSATTVPEEISKKFKTLLLPQIANLCSETEMFYNMYSRAHDDEKEKAKNVKELKPIKELYRCLMKSQDIIVKHISLKEELQTAPPEVEPEEDYDEGDETSGVERVLEALRTLISRPDAVQILSGLENVDLDELADQLESKMNTEESEDREF